MPNGIKVGGIEPYRKGDTITLNSYDYCYGLYYTSTGNHLVLNIPLNKPCAASGVTVTLGNTSYDFASTNGLLPITNVTVKYAFIASTSIQLFLNGTVSNPPTSFSPICLAIAGTTITFT